MSKLYNIKIGNLQAIIYHLEKGEDNGGISREALAEFLKSIKDILREDSRGHTVTNTKSFRKER